jgi:hypothetical protein
MHELPHGIVCCIIGVQHLLCLHRRPVRAR